MGKDIGSFREIFFQLYVLCRPNNVHFSSFALEVAQTGFLSFFSIISLMDRVFKRFLVCFLKMP